MKILIEHSAETNIEAFEGYWNAALAYQRANALPLWPDFPSAAIREEIRLGLHFRVVSGDSVLGFFSLALADPVIWEEMETGDAIYIHRMCVNPDSRGKRLASHVLGWACFHCVSINRNFIRMDTWGSNKTLIEYYQKCGFKVFKYRRLGLMPALPAHYSNIELVMFQNEAK
jgi:ribosomal protein S18 acetylase RimI-like enzyme